MRVLGINILGKFLGNRDNNIRYVALTTLCRICQTVASSDSSALQRHRSTILDCLKDPDISIRRRALDLSFFLINGQNIRILTRELLSFLEIAESDVKATVSSRICDYAGRFRPNRRWEVDTVCRVLRVAGAFVEQEVINHFVKIVTTAPPELQTYTVRKLYQLIKTEGDKAHSQEGLIQAAFWSIGEYGDVLVGSTNTSGLFGGLIGEDSTGSAADPEETQAKISLGELGIAPTERDVVDLIEFILKGPWATETVKEYALTALMKLISRFNNEGVAE